MVTPPGKPVSGINHSVSEEIFPAAQPEPALVQLEAVKSQDFAGAATANPSCIKTLRGSRSGCTTSCAEQHIGLWNKWCSLV